jgi:hypothetical protein
MLCVRTQDKSRQDQCVKYLLNMRGTRAVCNGAPGRLKLVAWFSGLDAAKEWRLLVSGKSFRVDFVFHWQTDQAILDTLLLFTASALLVVHPTVGSAFA